MIGHSSRLAPACADRSATETDVPSDGAGWAPGRGHTRRTLGANCSAESAGSPVLARPIDRSGRLKVIPRRDRPHDLGGERTLLGCGAQLAHVVLKPRWRVHVQKPHRRIALVAERM